MILLNLTEPKSLHALSNGTHYKFTENKYFQIFMYDIYILRCICLLGNCLTVRNKWDKHVRRSVRAELLMTLCAGLSFVEVSGEAGELHFIMWPVTALIPV